MPLLGLLRGSLCLALAAAAPAALQDDGVALVQAAVHASAAASRLAGKPVDCQAFPEVCHDGLFDCHTELPGTVLEITAPTNGHPNPNSMCKMKYLKGYAQCLKGDPLGAAETTYEVQGGHGGMVRKMDAQFCFAAGHCNNTKVTVNTTMAEMEQMCDQIYGHDVWTKVGFTIMFKAMGHMSDPGRRNPWSQMACAMGAFHCDVIYCKQKICNDPMWRGPFGHLAWWEPGEHWKGIIDKPSFRSDAVAAYKK